MVSTSGYNSDFDAVLGVPVQELIVDENLIENKASVSHCMVKQYHFTASYRSTGRSVYVADLHNEIWDTFSNEFK
jgi:hypothetical protein